MEYFPLDSSKIREQKSKKKKIAVILASLSVRNIMDQQCPSAYFQSK